MKVKSALRIYSAFASLLVMVGCSDARLSLAPPSKVNVTSSGDFCTLSPEAIKRYTKFMFVMDKSGSNQTTDPGCDKRCRSVEKFYNDNMSKEYLRWGMISFQDPGTRALIGEDQDPIFTDDETVVRTAITDLAGADEGGTPYRSALDLAQRGIENDIKTHPDEDNLYMIFFVSDGVPTDGSNESTLRDRVRNLVNVNPGKIFLSTGFYDAGGGNAGAEAVLRAMAEEGMGKFVNFRDTDEFNFDELIVGGPTKDPWMIKNMVVYNLNSSQCEDNTFDVDSDGDGLCDKDEVKYGLDPVRRFSKKDSGYSDYFHWRKIKFGETLAPCTDRSDEDFDLLTRCEETHIVNQTPISPSPDIIVPTRGDPLNPDTDLDGFMDGLEIMSIRTTLTSPMNARDVLENLDGEGSIGNQIKQHKMPTVWDPGSFAYDTKLSFKETRAETGQTCYGFSQSRLQVMPTKAIPADGNFANLVHGERENVVLVYFIQTPQREPLGKGIYMFSFQKLKAPTQSISDAFGDGAGLKVRDGVFSPYIVPKN